MTFIDGISGAQDATLHVQAPNFFRFHGDGAQWNAGLGDTVHNDAGWDTVAVIADDYSFGWTSAAGFIADFCAVGGEVVTRVFPPLGTTDYSSFVQQLPDPDEVDGYFWVVGGTGTEAALEAFVNAKGDLTGDQHAGNLFFNPALADSAGDRHRRRLRRWLRLAARGHAHAGDRRSTSPAPTRPGTRSPAAPPATSRRHRRRRRASASCTATTWPASALVQALNAVGRRPAPTRCRPRSARLRR